MAITARLRETYLLEGSPTSFRTREVTCRSNMSKQLDRGLRMVCIEVALKRVMGTRASSVSCTVVRLCEFVITPSSPVLRS